MLAEIDALGIETIVVAGDAASGPMPLETLDALASVTRCSRGNADRVLDICGANTGEMWVRAR